MRCSVALLLALAALATASLRDECVDTYADVYVASTTRDQRCSALHTLAMCFLNGVTDPTEQVSAQGFLDAAQFNEDCSAYAPSTANEEVNLENEGDSLLFSLGRGKDLTFSRSQLAEVVSIWDVSDKVVELRNMATPMSEYTSVLASITDLKVNHNKVFTKIKTDVLAWVDTRISEVAGEIMENLDMALQALQDAADEVNDNIDTRVTAYEGVIKTTTDKIVSTLVNNTIARNKINLANLTSIFNFTNGVDSRLNTLNSSIDTKLSNAFGATKNNAQSLITALSSTPLLNFQLPVFRTMQFSTYGQNEGWFCSNAANMFGGVNPSSWTDGGALAYSMSADKNVLRTLFTRKQYGGHNALVSAHEWYSYSSTNGEVTSALFRIRNKAATAVVWRTFFYYSCYGGWSEHASVGLNGNNMWSDGGNAGGSSSVNVDLTIPPNRISTAIFVATSGYQSTTRSNVLIFYNDCLKLPSGLEYVDDLDYATGGFEA